MSVRRTLAALLASGLLLTGCGDDPEPRFEPAPTPSPSETTSSPAEPEAQTPEAFVRAWFALNTDMQNSGNTDDFRAASKNCATCNDLADRVDQIYSDGGTIKIAWQKVVDIELGSHSRTIKQFDVTTSTSPTVFREAANARVKRYKGGKTTYLVTVVQDRGQEWHMESVQIG